MTDRILVRRGGAWGDVLLITPIIRRLRLENPDANITVQTRHPDVLIGPYWSNPDINHVTTDARGQFDRTIDLDGVYERDRSVHQVDMCMEAAFGDRDGDKTAFFPYLAANPVLPFNLDTLDWSKVVCVHPNVSWQNRTIPLAIWQQLCSRLTGLGMQVVILGTHIDQAVSGPWIHDTRGQLDACQQALAIHKARAYVGGCCGLLCLAAATETPLVTFLTILPEATGLFHRHGELGWNMQWTRPYQDGHVLDCFGCSAEYRDATFIGCKRSDYLCLSTFNVTEMTGAVLKAIKDDQRNG